MTSKLSIFSLFTQGFGMMNLNSMMGQPKVFQHYNDTDVTWFDSVQLCKKKGGVLAYFDNPYDHLTALRKLPMDGRYWVGYSDLEREGVWKTSVNEVPAYIKWVDGEPNDRFTNEDCAMLVMGPWGRGKLIDAKCDESTGIAEWTADAGYICRFDGPKRGPDGVVEEEVELELPEWATAAPKVQAVVKMTQQFPSFNMSRLDEIEEQSKSTKSDVSDNAKEIKLLKSDLADYTYDLQMVRNATSALKNDNERIFEQMNTIISKAQFSGKSAQLLEKVSLKSSVEEEESNFFMTHQKKLNKEIFAILGKQKKQIVRVKAELQISDGPDGAIDIEAFIEEQQTENAALKKTLDQVKMDNVFLKQSFETIKNELLEIRNRLIHG